MNRDPSREPAVRHSRAQAGQFLMASKLFVNEQPVQTLEFAKPVVDIGPFLQKGSNTVVAVVPTLMWNYISCIYKELEISGSKPMLISLPSKVDTGLIGEVKVIPYTVHHISP